MDKGDPPEGTLGCSAQRHDVVHCQHIGNVIDFLHARLCNSPTGVQQDLMSWCSLVYKPAYDLAYAYAPLAFCLLLNNRLIPAVRNLLHLLASILVISNKPNLPPKSLSMEPHLSYFREISIMLDHGLSG